MRTWSGPARNTRNAAIVWIVASALSTLVGGADVAAVVAMGLAPFVAMAFVVSVMIYEETG